MKPFLERIREGPLVCFGAIATVLIERGFDISGCLGQWLIEHPRDLEWITKEYVDAGCEIIASAGSQGCRWRLQRWGLQEKVVEINSKVTKIVRYCTPDDRYVAGTITPSGRMLKPLGDMEPEELYNAYKEEVTGYMEGGADILWIMTMMDLDEAVIAIRAARDFSKLPVIASLSFDYTPKGARTIMGIDPKTAVMRLEEAGADIVGHNCGGATPRESTRILGEMAEVTTRPLVVKPNAGKPVMLDGSPSWPFTPDNYAEEVNNWIASGARIVGGCCGTTPEHARRMKEKLSKQFHTSPFPIAS